MHSGGRERRSSGLCSRCRPARAAEWADSSLPQSSPSPSGDGEVGSDWARIIKKTSWENRWGKTTPQSIGPGVSFFIACAVAGDSLQPRKVPQYSKGNTTLGGSQPYSQACSFQQGNCNEITWCPYTHIPGPVKLLALSTSRLRIKSKIRTFNYTSRAFVYTNLKSVCLPALCPSVSFSCWCLYSLVLQIQLWASSRSQPS